MLITTALALLVFVLLLWGLSLLMRNASIIDCFWGLGFILVCTVGLRFHNPPTPHQVLLAGMVFLWGARLSLYLTRRNWGQPEDYRYKAMRDHNGPSFAWKSLFTVFLLQGFLTWFISLPLQVAIAAESPVPWDGLALVGVVIFLAGLTFESIGDWELARFKAKPENQGKVMDQGLWRYTRHPNYFGDALVWWGLYITALPAPYVTYTVLSPLVMTLLLMKVSGVPLLEKRMAETRPKYAEYARKTPAFFPWRPKN